MSNEKSVTTRQAEQIRKMANEKGIGRELFQNCLLDAGMMSRVLDGIKEGLPITIGIPLIPPLGGQIRLVKIRFQLDQGWQEAINAGGPETPDERDVRNVRKVGDLYPPTGTGFVEEELILLNYPISGGSWKEALIWSEQLRLRRTDPRRVFAVGKNYPNFGNEVEMNPILVVATEECMFNSDCQACGIWWYDSVRHAFLHWVSDYGSKKYTWFAFRR